MKNFIFLILIVLTFQSCFQEDEIVQPLEIDIIEIPYSMYEYQTYFNLENAEVVSYNYFADWDLGFESKKGGYHVILNYAKFMYCGETDVKNFESINANISDTMIYDASNGDLSKLALNKWVDLSDVNNPIFTQEVFVIDLGKDELGNTFGTKKLQIQKMQQDTFTIRFSNLDGSEDYTFKIPKDTTTIFTLFSFENGGNLDTKQPNKKDWDICFTKYSSTIPDNAGVLTPYIVRGVYSNTTGVMAAVDTTDAFYEINIEDIDSYIFSDEQDKIGYEWKYYSGGLYNMEENIFYLIKDLHSKNYKLKFTGYYNEDGIKGYPSFELFKLN